MKNLLSISLVLILGLIPGLAYANDTATEQEAVEQLALRQAGNIRPLCLGKVSIFARYRQGNRKNAVSNLVSKAQAYLLSLLPSRVVLCQKE